MPEGHDADAFRKVALENFNLSLGQGLTKVAGKVFRIGHLGDFNDLMLMGALSASRWRSASPRCRTRPAARRPPSPTCATPPRRAARLTDAPLRDAGLAVGAAGPGDDPRAGDRGPLRVRADPVAAQLGHADGRHAGRLHGGDAVMRIPALVTDDVTLTDSHAICDYLNADSATSACWRAKGRALAALATMASPAACSRRRSCGAPSCCARTRSDRTTSSARCANP
jgi:hypothetical protein